MSQRTKRIIKAAIFLLVLAVILVVCNFILQPVWMWSSQYDRINGFYEEPEDTIETVFLGSSQVEYGISPMELYEQNGICAYNLATASQPVLASYYWLEEAYRLHSKTLNTVVLEVEMLKKDNASSWYHMAIDPMKFSSVKLSAVKAYSSDFPDFLQNLIPLFSYHERWKDLTDEDFKKSSYEPLMCIRGQYVNTTRWINRVDDFTEIDMPLFVADEAAKKNLKEEAVNYLDKMVSFCEQHDLNLVLIKAPTDWTSGDHNAVQYLADAYGVPFLDFNFEPYYSDIDFNYATDFIYPISDGNMHLNYGGSVKLSSYLGKYLAENCGDKDIRGEEKYAFMEDELADFKQFVTGRQSFLSAEDPCDYIAGAIAQGKYTIFISAKEEAAAALSDEQRAYFASIGLKKLSGLTDGASYLAVISDGKVVAEESEADPGEENARNTPLTYAGTMSNGMEYSLASGGRNLGDTSSIVIGAAEFSENKRGLNITLYDNKHQQSIDTANFDTDISPERTDLYDEEKWNELMKEGDAPSSLTGVNRTLYLYDKACEDKEKLAYAMKDMAGDADIVTYVEAFLKEKDIDIFLSTNGDVSDYLTDSLREELSSIGLTDLAGLSKNEAYAAVLSDGEITEETGDAASPLTISTQWYTLTSGGRGALDTRPSVIINGTEYQPEQEGIFVVLYDRTTGQIVDTRTFGSEKEDPAGDKGAQR